MILTNYIYLFIFVCAGVFFTKCRLSLVVVSGDYSVVPVCRLLIAVDSLFAEHGL